MPTTTRLPPARGSHRYEPLVVIPDGDFNEKEASSFLSTPVRTLQTWRYRGQGPKYLRIGDGPKARVRYTLAELQAWPRRRGHRVVPDPANTHAARVRAERERSA
jgi:hypothetical protein